MFFKKIGRKHSKNEERNTETNRKETFYKKIERKRLIKNRKEALKKRGRKHRKKEGKL